jgi:hypothetical protein
MPLFPDVNRVRRRRVPAVSPADGRYWFWVDHEVLKSLIQRDAHGGNIEAAWAQLSLAQKRAILQVVADVHVLPTKASIKSFNPDGVWVDWKVG